jgi:hypothetical protein
MSISDYFDKLSIALMDFQYLEVTLKFYIRDCDRIIQKSVKDSFHYSVRENEIEKMPLGRLIEEFSRRSNRSDIASFLKRLNAHRNHIAHSAYVLTIEEQTDPKRADELSQRIVEVTEAVKACMKELTREHSRVTKDPIPDGLLEQL